MEYLLIAWFITASGAVAPSPAPIITRMNTEVACNKVLMQGYSQNLRGFCTFDPVKK